MDDFEKIWRKRVEDNIRNENNPELSQIYENIQEKDPVNFSRSLISNLRENLSDSKIRNLFSNCACHMPKEKLIEVKKIYELSNSMEVARKELEVMFIKDIKLYKQLSDDHVEDIIKRGWGAAGKYHEGYIVATKIPSRFHEYFSESDPMKKAYNYCHCPRVRNELLNGRNLDSVYCNCGGGFYKGIWEYITGRTINVTVLKNLFDGDDVCQFKISIAEV